MPQVVVTFQFETFLNICAIASVLRNPTNSTEASVTDYIVRVDGSSVPHRNVVIIPPDGTRHSALVYEASCDARRISISANSTCGESPSTNEVMLDPELRFMLNATLFGSAGNIEGKQKVHLQRSCTFTIIYTQ